MGFSKDEQAPVEVIDKAKTRRFITELKRLKHVVWEDTGTTLHAFAAELMTSPIVADIKALSWSSLQIIHILNDDTAYGDTQRLASAVGAAWVTIRKPDANTVADHMPDGIPADANVLVVEWSKDIPIPVA
mgnify:CR=1 FL=1